MNLRKSIIVNFAVLFVGMAIALSLAWVGVKYKYDQAESIRAVDARPCVVDVGKTQVHGERKYTYRYRELFGFRIIETDKIEEATSYKLVGDDMIVLSIQTDGTHTRFVHQLGDIGSWDLQDADYYTFTTKAGSGVATYQNFCK